jgi:hypothetical protein
MKTAVTSHAAKIATTTTARWEVPCAQSNSMFDQITAPNTENCSTLQSMAKDSP